jgi:hypothetical protein
MFFAFGVMPVTDVPHSIVKLSKSNGLTWGQIERLLGALRKDKPDLTIGALHVFLHIARRVGAQERPYIKTVAEGVGMQYSSAARLCDLLSGGVGSSDGLGWIAKIEDRTSRAKYLTLTNAGAYMLASALEATETGGHDENFD